MIKTLNSMLCLVLFMAYVDNNEAARIYRNSVEISQNNLPRMEGIKDLFRKNGNDLVNIEGSTAYGTLRFGNREGQLPFTFTFTDRQVDT